MLNTEQKDEELIEDSTDTQAKNSDYESKGWLANTALFFLELVKIAVLAGITIGLVRYFIFKPFYVEGQSMDPAYHEKEYLIIDEISYRFREPERGEVVVLRAPTIEKDFYLKRIIGMPGERVKVENDKIIIYNNENSQGVVLEEIYLEDKTTPGETTVTLASDEYFVMGDNRRASFDSRRFGPVKKEAIIGRTWLRGWPIDRVTLFETPTYNF